MMLRKILPALFFVSMMILSSSIYSQNIQIDTTMTPQELVEQVLLGSGVTVSNITFNGQPADILNNQAAKYTGPSNLISFNEGLLLKSGHTFQVQESGFFGPGPSPNITQDSDLQALAGQSIHNAAILEFDFIPNGDSLQFRYVFASKEYPSFTCSNYNDVFGFFISGPGINGPFQNNAINIALIPDSDIPVGINTLNSGQASNPNNAPTCEAANPDWIEHSQYFISNSSEPAGDIQFPGLTVALTAFANVQCGEVYHIKLAIADAFDSALDSGVFLEAGSFTSSSAIQVLLDTPVGLNDSTLYEGCGSALIKFVRPEDGNNIGETAYLNITGTGLNGIDFVPPLPDSVYFPPGVDTVSFEIFAPVKPNFGGVQYVNVEIENIASECSNAVITSDFTFYINRADPLEVYGFEDIVSLVDCHDEVQLFPTVIGGYGEYVYNWSNGMNQDTITVSPGQSTTYFVTVSDTCGVPGIQVSFDVDVPVYPPIIVDIGDDFEVAQCDVLVDIESFTTGGFGDYSYHWTGNGEFIYDQKDLHYLIEHTTLVKLVVTDDCDATGSDEITITIPEMEVTAHLPDVFQALSCTKEIMLPAISDGGIGQRKHIWVVDGIPQDTTLSNFFMYHPSMGQNVELIAVDECGNLGVDSTFIPFNFPKVEIETSRDTAICARTHADLWVKILDGSGGYKIDWSGSDSSHYRVYPKNERFYTVTVTDTCGVTAKNSINVDVRNPRADFDYEYIPYYGLQFTNYSRAVEPTYLWDFGDGNTSVQKDPRHLYSDIIPYRVTLTVTDDLGCTDVRGFTTEPPLEIFIPKAFTPNGDGINDSFEIKGSNIKEFSIRIFDRWGNMVFHSNDINERWDGSNAKDGYHSGTSVYNYIIRYKGPKEEDTKEIKGDITVIR